MGELLVGREEDKADGRRRVVVVRIRGCRWRGKCMSQQILGFFFCLLELHSPFFWEEIESEMYVEIKRNRDCSSSKKELIQV